MLPTRSLSAARDTRLAGAGEEADGCRTPGNCSSGSCEPCPETEGSDCSRCANPPSAADNFPAPSFPGYSSNLAVYDQVKVPKLAPGKYVVGFRYDCVSQAVLCIPPKFACSFPTDNRHVAPRRTPRHKCGPTVRTSRSSEQQYRPVLPGLCWGLGVQYSSANSSTCTGALQ